MTQARVTLGEARSAAGIGRLIQVGSMTTATLDAFVFDALTDQDLVSITRLLVEAQGGRIEMESQLGPGSPFRVFFARAGGA